MKTNLVRIISLILSAVMVFTLFCGCKKDNEEENVDNSLSSDTIENDDNDNSDSYEDEDESNEDEWDEDESNEDEWDEDESNEDEWDYEEWEEDTEVDEEEPEEEPEEEEPEEEEPEEEEPEEEEPEEEEPEEEEPEEEEPEEEEPEEEEPEEDDWDEYLDYYNPINFKVYNSQAPVITNYRGVSSSVYHAYGFMKDDNRGRVYTDEMMDLELSRLYDSGIRYCRTIFSSSWAWNSSSRTFNWDSRRMSYFYDYAKALAAQDTSVMLNFGWNFEVALGNGARSLGEVSYLTGTTLDDEIFTDYQQIAYENRFDAYPEKYGETANYTEELAGYDSYWRNLAIVGLRYGEFLAQALENMQKRGINNISHVFYFTEPSNYTETSLKGEHADEYIFVVDYMQKKLKERGYYDCVSHVGPDQGSISHGDGLLRYLLQEKGRTDMFNVLSAHLYPSASDITKDVYADIANETFTSYTQPLKDVGIFNNEAGKEFWVDEFYCVSSNDSLGDDNGWAGLQNVVSFLMAQKHGIQNISLWQIFDQLWTDQNNSGGEFNQGIHVVGSAPSLFVSSIPHAQYYSTGLFTKYNGYKNGTVYKTNNYEDDAFGGYIGCVKLEDGNYTVTVVNPSLDPMYFTVDFEEAINKTLYRHMETVTETLTTTAARIADPDKTFVAVEDKFCDSIPGASVVVYTSVKG